MDRRNIQFTQFQEKYPKFTDRWANDYFESMVCSMPPVLQYGFFGYTVTDVRRIIKQLPPVEILCGNKELLERCRRHLPKELHSIINLHPWYEDCIYVILVKEEMQVKAT